MDDCDISYIIFGPIRFENFLLGVDANNKKIIIYATPKRP
jgi:hypothetical protein